MKKTASDFSERKMGARDRSNGCTVTGEKTASMDEKTSTYGSLVKSVNIWHTRDIRFPYLTVSLV